MPDKFWEIKNAGKAGEVLIYGDIVSYKWDDSAITAASFKEDLDALGDVDTLNIYINSSGGNVFQGQAIYSILKRHKARKVVYVDGIAASIASVIAMAGDAIFVPENAMMMIHNPWMIAMGNAADFRKIADDLDKVTVSIKATYMQRFNQGEDKLTELLDAETWLTAKECLEYGLCDETTPAKQIAASINKDFGYQNVPETLFRDDRLDDSERKALLGESKANIDKIKKILGGM